MTKYDDAKLNTDNPLELRSWQTNGSPYIPGVGNPKYPHAQSDGNLLNVMRYASAWTARLHLKNEVVYHEGFFYVAVSDTSNEPAGALEPAWVPLTGINGRGGMFMDATSTPGTDLGLVYDPITEFTTVDVAAIGCTLNPTADTFQFNYPGTWQISYNVIFEHNSSNQGRLCGLRLWNVPDAVEVGEIIAGTGRNAEATTFSGSALFPITASGVDKDLRWELGGYDVYTSVLYRAVSMDIVQIGI